MNLFLLKYGQASHEGKANKGGDLVRETNGITYTKICMYSEEIFGDSG